MAVAVGLEMCDQETGRARSAPRMCSPTSRSVSGVGSQDHLASAEKGAQEATTCAQETGGAQSATQTSSLGRCNASNAGRASRVTLAAAARVREAEKANVALEEVSATAIGLPTEAPEQEAMEKVAVEASLGRRSKAEARAVKIEAGVEAGRGVGVVGAEVEVAEIKSEAGAVAGRTGTGVGGVIGRIDLGAEGAGRNVAVAVRGTAAEADHASVARIAEADRAGKARRIAEADRVGRARRRKRRKKVRSRRMTRRKAKTAVEARVARAREGAKAKAKAENAHGAGNGHGEGAPRPRRISGAEPATGAKPRSEIRSSLQWLGMVPKVLRSPWASEQAWTPMTFDSGRSDD